jgi:DNA-binding MarR family transcriptional regulator/GNAT superfamily N-acetyltransferase
MSKNSAVRPAPDLGARVAAVREFSRFYTGLLGLLREGLLDTPYSLTEARVIFELARDEHTEVTDLRRVLNIDAGYLSRLLARFEADGLVVRRRSEADGRRQVIVLTQPGRAAFRLLDDRSARQIAALLAGRTEEDQQRLAGAMASVMEVLARVPRPQPAVRLRLPGPGDLGWVVQAHGAAYAAEYGWDETFEALVARIVADFAASHDPRRDRAWLAEVDGRPAGCVFCIGQDTATAQLRLLLVEPGARGLGLGQRLVDACVCFAREAGYAELVLWTNDVLTAARRIYQQAGFRLTSQQEHHSFGHDLVGQNWRLAL